MGKVSSLSVASCLLATAVLGVPGSNVEFSSGPEWVVASGSVPEVAVVGDDNKTYVVSSYTKLDAQHFFSSENSLVNAMVTFLGDDRWKLDLQAKQHLRRIYFPAQTKRTPVASRVSDEIFYYPRILGLAEKASARNTDWDWGPKFIYPGQLFAPLVVLASSSEAKSRSMHLSPMSV
ncbi:MAG: hypothetical protein DMG10_08610 [Acidobacteria bacterium]|nr:MAG: hypothetical protein DMG10_08610 [Acidobacteriota bacterium]